MWFVAIGSGWISYLMPDGKLVPVVNCNPPTELGQTCGPQGTRWLNKLYQTKELKTLVYAYLNQLFKGPNDLDFDCEGTCSLLGLGERVRDRTWPTVGVQSTSTRTMAHCTS